MKYFLAVLALVLNSDCSSNFLKQDKLQSLNLSPGFNDSIIYYNKEFIYNDDGIIIAKTHYLIKTGHNAATRSDFLAVENNSIYKLLSFDAQVIGTKGMILSYGKGDLIKMNLSSNYRISKSYVYILPEIEKINPGDMIEVVYEHEYTLPQLGIYFSLPEMGSAVTNISCEIIIPSGRNLTYRVINSSITPEVKDTMGIKVYKFYWDRYLDSHPAAPFSYSRRIPGVIASYLIPGESHPEFTWKDFGNWYLDAAGSKLVPGNKLKAKAQELTFGMNDTLEMLNTIFNYCQKNIRYEQVYLQHGEIIPNSCDLILEHGYGDCKDYASIVYSMAKSIGLNPSLALCYRGRGEMPFYNITASQFNHMILHLNYKGKDYWYDGTNRLSIPGKVTNDLVNQTAVILAHDNTRIIKIEESPAALLEIEANFKAVDNDLTGELKIVLNDQYAIDFFFLDLYLNNNKMEDYILNWAKENISKEIIIAGVTPEKFDQKYSLRIKCTLPNTLINIEKYTYLAFNRVFPQLSIEPIKGLSEKDIDYYPLYAKIKLIFSVSNLYTASSEKNNSVYMKYHQNYPSGPFDETERLNFLHTFKKSSEDYSLKYKFTRVDSK